jgi:uncharacterized protein YlxW (UPF0749 family)
MQISKIKKIKKSELLILITALVVGILIFKQAAIVFATKDVVQEDNMIKLSYEIIELSDSNFELQGELNRLRAKNDSFSFDIKDKAGIKEGLEKKVNGYRATNGFDSISGRGVEIKIDGSMITEEMVDLINGIRNTKPDAIGVNGKRVIYKTYFIVNSDNKLEIDGKKFDFPVSVQVIGDPDVLRSSLDRSGGILDILKKNSSDKIRFAVENRDNIDLPPYDGSLDLRYAKTLSY